MFTKFLNCALSSGENQIRDGRSNKPAALYFHYPCFDGLVSAALAWLFLEHEKNWRIDQLCPISYETRSSWISAQLHQRAAVVDFLYHPQASFWADHHTTAFLTKDLRTDYEMKIGQEGLLFDAKAASCATLLWNHLHSCIPNASHYEEMVFWAAKIDSADYSSPHEAIWSEAPAMQISSTLALSNEPEYPVNLLKELLKGNLHRIAQLPVIRNKAAEVKKTNDLRASRGAEESNSSNQ